MKAAARNHWPVNRTDPTPLPCLLPLPRTALMDRPWQLPAASELKTLMCQLREARRARAHSTTPRRWEPQKGGGAHRPRGAPSRSGALGSCLTDPTSLAGTCGNQAPRLGSRRGRGLPLGIASRLSRPHPRRRLT